MSTEQAWASGFFAGEGCSSTRICRPKDRPHEYKQLILVVTQCGDEAPEILKRFRQAVGYVGRVDGPVHRGTYLPQYRWQTESFENAPKGMRLLWPWLTRTKKQQFIRAYRTVARYKRYLKMHKKDPMISLAAPDPGPVAGIDNLPLPMGVSRSGRLQAEQAARDVSASMSPNNGDNPSVPEGGLTSGTDSRVYSQSSPKSDPTPSMPGA